MKLKGKETGAKQIKEIESEGWETQAEHGVKDRVNEIQGVGTVPVSDGAAMFLWNMDCESQHSTHHRCTIG